MIPIPVNEPLLDGNEKKYLNQSIDTGWISSEGPLLHNLNNNLRIVWNASMASLSVTVLSRLMQQL